MIREEAREFLIAISYKLGNMSVEYLSEKDGEKMREAIKALEQEPTTKNNLAVDCISRADALDCVNWGYSFSDIYKKINELPSVTPQEPRKGHWIEKEDWGGDVYYECSVCGEPFCLIDGTPTDNMYHFCPNCGAKMESEVEE